ncbi:MAG: autotransporter outer membrane beta-barrel domain-containing protein [Candidatus Accumulibacter sp.]|jgi:outer membrane autotransporter protein|nr:autotransporter outer membrane beta-barrel domain-containing protein [Accumulibacter sp.]
MNMPFNTKISFRPAPIALALAFALAAGPALAGSLVIDTALPAGEVYGNGTGANGQGKPTDLDTSGNSVTVKSGGNVPDAIYGGFVENYSSGTVAITANGNALTIEGGTANSDILGGYAENFLDAATANNNTTTVKSGTAASIDIVGGFAEGETGATANNNTTIVTGGNTSGSWIIGGDAESTLGDAVASYNTVVVKGVTAGNVLGGSTNDFNGSPTTTLATASNNTVTITDSTVDMVWGGYTGAYRGAAYHVSNDNTVTLAGNTDVVYSVYGGGGDNGMPNYNGATGNTLNVVAPKNGGITIGNNLKYFQNLNFYVPASMGAGGVMLRVSNTAYIDGATVNVGIDGASSPLRVGDAITLIDAGTLDGAPANTAANGQGMQGHGMQGVTLLYDFDIDVQGNKLVATLSNINSSSPRAKALSEGYLAGMGFLNRAGDAVAGQGIGLAVEAARVGRGTFASLSGGALRLDTGSHIDMHGVSLMAGIAASFGAAGGRLTLGGFVEAGNGSYDTYNSFAGAASVKGDGDIRHYGVGLLGRLDAQGGFYAEASVRAGRLENDYGSSSLRDTSGRKAKYDSDSGYYGLHVGGGKLWKIDEVSSFDLYGKWFWTHQEGDKVRLRTGDPVDFDGVDSNRLRIGARYARSVSERTRVYAGLAWEHEYDGKAKAKTNGYRLDAPKLEGDTGIAELGLTLTPTKGQPLFVDIGVQGYAGRREGVTGGVRVRYDF